MGYYSAKNLWRHRKQCDANPEKGSSGKRSQALGQTLLLGNIKVDIELKVKVFPRMRPDKVSLVAKNDKLICAFASRYLKLHRELHFVQVVSRKMRELARLLMEIKKLDLSVVTLFDALKPHKYDILVKATKLTSGYDDESQTYKSPTYAMNMGTTLKQCCDVALLHVLKKSKSLPTVDNANVEADIKTCIQLIEANWRFDISTNAANDLNLKKWNKVTLVPLATDLKLLKDYLMKVAANQVSMLQKNPSNEKAYTSLLETVYCRLLLLNRRRPGELQRLPIHVYKSAISEEHNQAYEEFSEAITETERILMRSFKRIVIRGKRGRGVPVLISKDVQDHLNLILECRDNIQTVSNIYLFGKPNSQEPIIGYKVIKKYASLCQAKNPHALTSTRLRKHLATLTQLFNMSENDMEQLASFMGHTLGIHRASYRLPDDVYQTARLSKILTLMEKGEAGHFKGKSLDEINLNLDENLISEAQQDDNHPEPLCQYEDIQEPHPDPESQQVDITLPKKKSRVLVPWTEDQKNLVLVHFGNHIKSKRAPKKAECDNLIASHTELLHNKDWLKIKVFIQNQYRKKK
ncbi:unnamed protein product [Acanthoscelides obtectus]|nr:unnamed protein product [Acanthoscelides obtectus]CAK1667765.1 hypothetical protein AOBTE_LOCUS26028 [Acanthoscelides obtectus]